MKKIDVAVKESLYGLFDDIGIASNRASRALDVNDLQLVEIQFREALAALKGIQDILEAGTTE